MKQFTVKMTQAALDDMEQMYQYIADKLLAPKSAMGQYNRIAEAILTLDTMPERFQTVDIEWNGDAVLRRMPVDNYSVFYVIADDCVIVTNVLYSASDMERRL